jgi:hypothetical protein
MEQADVRQPSWYVSGLAEHSLLALKELMKMFRVVFWDILPCKMIVDRRFRGAYCLHHPMDMNNKLHLKRALIFVSDCTPICSSAL